MLIMDLGKYFRKRKIIGKGNVNMVLFFFVELNIYDPMKMKILVKILGFEF